MVFIYRERLPEEKMPGLHPLGRNVHKDSRNALYPFTPKEKRELSVVLYQRHIPILDQGQMGSCTGNALVGAVATSPDFESLPANHPVLDETLAVKVYCAAVVIGGDVCSNDPGSDGIDVCKAAQQMGLIGGYTHCTDLATMQQAMMERSTIIGINWYSSFDTPASNGMVSISRNAYVRGGHEVQVIGMDPTAQTFVCENSWGPDWGYNGTFQFSFATMDRLLSEQGDCTVPLPDSVPPVTDSFAHEWPLGIQAWCRGTRTRADLVQLKQQLQAAAVGEGLPL